MTQKIATNLIGRRVTLIDPNEKLGTWAEKHSALKERTAGETGEIAAVFMSDGEPRYRVLMDLDGELFDCWDFIFRVLPKETEPEAEFKPLDRVLDEETLVELGICRGLDPEKNHILHVVANDGDPVSLCGQPLDVPPHLKGKGHPSIEVYSNPIACKRCQKLLKKHLPDPEIRALQRALHGDTL